MAYYATNYSTEASNVLPGGKAGVALAAGDLVYLDSSGNYQLAAAGTHAADGVMPRAALQYEFINPVKVAIINGWSSQTVGAPAYLSTTGTTGNTITATKPVGVQVQQIGIFTSATDVMTCIQTESDSSEEGSISIFGSDGKFKASYATIDLACAALANSDIIKIKSGEYTLTSAISITKTDVQIIGEGNVTIVGFAGADYCFKTVFGAITSTKGITFKNLTISHADDATQIGIEVANVSAAGRINVYLTDVSFESDGGNSIQVDHTVTTASIRLYVTGGTIEGPVNYTVGNTDDRIRFEGTTLRGGLVTGTSATAMEILLERCKILHQGVTGGNNAQLMYVMYCLSETDANPNVYAAVDTSDLAGSQNETVLFPTS